MVGYGTTVAAPIYRMLCFSARRGSVRYGTEMIWLRYGMLRRGSVRYSLRHGMVRLLYGYGTVCCSTTRHGTVRYGIGYSDGMLRGGEVRCGTVSVRLRYGILWHGTARHDTARHGTLRCGMGRYRTVVMVLWLQYSMLCHDTARCGMGWYDTVRCRALQYSPVRCGMVQDAVR